MTPDLFRAALEYVSFQDGSPSALVLHCMQLVPFVVVFAPAPQTSWDHHCAGVQPICASAHLCISRCLLVFVLFHSSLFQKKKKPGCNKERKQAVWALKGRNKKIKCEVGSAVEVSQGGCFVKAAQTGFSQTSLKAVLTRRCWQSEGGRTEGGQKGEGGEFENCIHTPTCAWVQKNRIL